jgi:hypothetical protein
VLEVDGSFLALYVGDPHAKGSNLDEARALMAYVLEVAVSNSVRFVCLLGDLHDTHAVVRLEVQNFWAETFVKAYDLGVKIVALTGNHDRPGPVEKEHMSALSVFKHWSDPGLIIVDEPTRFENIAFIPYMSSQERLVEAATALYERGAKKCAVMHQTLTGAAYDNGFYAKDAIDPALIPQEQIIVGHIHKEQQIGKAWYPGTARWDTLTDANQNKGIWLVRHGADGSYFHKQLLPTAHVCRPIKTFEVSEGDAVPDLDAKDRNHVTLTGSSEWIAKAKKKIGDRARIKAVPTDSLSRRLSPESRLVSIDSFMEGFEPSPGVTRASVLEYIQSLGGP